VPAVSSATPAGTGLQFRVIQVAGSKARLEANSLRGPALVNVDAGLDGKVRLTERFELRFRAESFNLANTPHHANPGTTSATSTSVNSGSFMLATDIRNTRRDGLDERTFRMGSKLTW